MEKRKPDYIIYTDGGSRGNPGNAGAGAVIKDAQGNILKEISEPLGENTNNFAEYSAIVFALEGLRHIVHKNDRKKVHVEVRMDSQLACRQLSGEWKLEKETLWPLFMKIHNMEIEHFPNVTFVHIPREENKEADALANRAMDMDTEGTPNLFD